MNNVYPIRNDHACSWTPEPPIQTDAVRPLMTTEELAAYLRVDPSTIRRWRTAEPVHGPPFIHMSGRLTLYAWEDVEQWIAAKRVTPKAAR